MATQPEPTPEKYKAALNKSEQVEMSKEWAERLQKIDSLLQDFSKLPKNQRAHAVSDLSESFREVSKTLSAVVYGFPESLTKDTPNNLKLFPANVAQTLSTIASQTPETVHQSPFWKMSSRLDKTEIKDSYSRGDVWDLPEGRFAMKEVQRLWTDTKGKIDVILKDPTVLNELHKNKMVSLSYTDAGMSELIQDSFRHSAEVRKQLLERHDQAEKPRRNATLK